MLRFDTPPARLRSVALLEGASFVLLVCVAVPLKHLADLPTGVRVVGPLHGLLFLWLMVLLVEGRRRRGRPLRWAICIAIASVLPFGTFVIDRRLRAEDDVYRRDARSD